MIPKFALRLVSLAVLLPLVLGGCSLFHNRSEWDKAVETRPLEIPPDLEAPSGGNQLVVPEAGGSARSAARNGAATGIDGLHVNDTPAGAWQRIGTALERAKLGEVSSRDETSHTYELTISTTRNKNGNAGWFKRTFMRKQTETVTERVNIGVSADGTGSRVSVSGGSASVQRVVATLRERLG
ncbi:MAG: hypothetical protein ABI411_11515 [Tahibacter sp.]